MTPEAVVQRIGERLNSDMESEGRKFLWTAVYLLSGLRYTPEQAAILLRGVRELKESSTYQAILEEGREEGRASEARAMLLRIGGKRFGEPSEAAREKLETYSLERLEALAERIFEVETWDEFLA